MIMPILGGMTTPKVHPAATTATANGLGYPTSAIAGIRKLSAATVAILEPDIELMTAPVTETEVVLGKFLAAFTVLLVMVLLSVGTPALFIAYTGASWLPAGPDSAWWDAVPSPWPVLPRN